jgi:hypothetical protein
MSVTIPRIAEATTASDPSDPSQPSSSLPNFATPAASSVGVLEAPASRLAAAAVAAPPVTSPSAPRRVAPAKPALTPAQKFRLRVGRPLLAGLAFATLILVGLPVAVATYTRDSANPVAWRNLSLLEVQGKLQYCFKKPAVASVFSCDYGQLSTPGPDSPPRGRVHRVVILKPYPVAGPVIYDPPAPSGVSGQARASGSGGAPDQGGRPAGQVAPVAGNFPVINFPAGPMAAIEATCEAAKNAAQGQSSAYQQNVERQCEAAKQAYERSHP